MKTIIFNGSPRINGDTVFLINALKERLNGDVRIVNAYRDDIHACVDCRFCWKYEGCAINDAMTELYDYIETCDNAIIASPVYFSELTGPILSVGSRLQTYFAAKCKRKAPVFTKPYTRRGGIILCGGGDGAPDKAEDTAKTFLHVMGVEPKCTVMSLHTDDVPAKDDGEALRGIIKMADIMNA